MIPTRHPTVGGTFYPTLPARLRTDVRRYLGEDTTARRALGVVAPHSVYTYSGATAGVAFAAVEVPSTCVVLAPNHSGRHNSAEGGSILRTMAYRTPLGEMSVDRELADAIVERTRPLLDDDEVAHDEEHAIEAVLPFLQMRNPTARLVPIIVAWRDWERTRALAEGIVAAIGAREDVLVVASSDMSHDEPADVAKDKDSLALEQILALDGRALLDVARRDRISLCGLAPVACACETVRLRGGRGGELVGYSHSGLVSGDDSRVVAYAGIVLGAE